MIQDASTLYIPLYILLTLPHLLHLLAPYIPSRFVSIALLSMPCAFFRNQFFFPFVFSIYMCIFDGIKQQKKKKEEEEVDNTHYVWIRWKQISRSTYSQLVVEWTLDDQVYYTRFEIGLICIEPMHDWYCCIRACANNIIYLILDSKIYCDLGPRSIVN